MDQNKDALRRLNAINRYMRDYSGSCNECKSICCTQSVATDYLEFTNILNFLRENLKFDDTKIRELFTKEPEKRELNPIQQAVMGGKDTRYCRLLVGNRCLVYEVRMYACRTYRFHPGYFPSSTCGPDWTFPDYDRKEHPNLKASKRLINLNNQSAPEGLRDEHPLEFWIELYLKGELKI